WNPIGLGPDAYLGRQRDRDTGVLAARGRGSLAAQGLEHEVTLLRLLGRELHQRPGAYAQPRQSRAPRDHGAADEDPGVRRLANQLDDDLRAVLQLLRRGTEETALGLIGLIQAPELLGALASDAENVQLGRPPYTAVNAGVLESPAVPWSRGARIR